MISWGIVATAMAWVNNELSFDILRFLLGAAEAGFIPCIMWYFSNWFPAGERGKIMAIFMSSTALANIIGAPLSTGLMGLDGAFGMRGWQLMFILEGLPSVLIGIWVLFFLTEKPEEAKWLTPDERRWLSETLREERAQAGIATSLRAGFLDRRVLMVAAVCFFLVCANFGIVFWLPQIVKSFGGLSNMQVGALSALPYVLAGCGMIWWGHHSDKTGDRRWHLLIAAIVGAAGLVASGIAPTPLMSFIGLIVAALGVWSMFGVFWALPGDFLRGMAAAGGLALINSIGTVGGFVGPYVVGFAREKTGSFTASLVVLAISALISGLLALAIRRTPQPDVINVARTAAPAGR
jgi:MFS family permease